MIYHGHIENGHIVLDESVALPDGVQVSVQVQEQPNPIDQTTRLRGYFGSISSGDSHSADSSRIDDDLARAYGADI